MKNLCSTLIYIHLLILNIPLYLLYFNILYSLNVYMNYIKLLNWIKINNKKIYYFCIA